MLPPSYRTWFLRIVLFYRTCVFTVSGTHIRREHDLAVLGIWVEHSFLLIRKGLVSLSIIPVFLYRICAGQDAGGPDKLGRE